MKQYRQAIEELDRIAGREEEVVVEQIRDRVTDLYDRLSDAHSHFSGDVKERDQALSELERRLWATQVSKSNPDQFVQLSQKILDTKLSLDGLRFDGLRRMHDNMQILLALGPGLNPRGLSEMPLEQTLQEHGLNAVSAVPFLGWLVAGFNAVRIELRRRQASDTFQEQLKKAADLLRYFETLDLIEHKYIPALGQRIETRGENLSGIDEAIREVGAALDVLEDEH